MRFGIIGCGSIAHAHMKALASIDGAEIAAVCDISADLAQKAAESTGAAVYTDYREMARSEKLDIAVINLPHALHGDCTACFAEQKIHVFLEKPMGVSVSECQKMIDVCKRNGVLLWVGHVQRYFPENIAAKALVDSGKYGKLIGIHETRNVFYFSEKRPRWFLDPAMSGGGIMVNLGAHTLDKIKYFTESEIDFAQGLTTILGENRVEGSVQAIVRTKNGVGASLNLFGYINAVTYDTILYLTEGEIRLKLDDKLERRLTVCGKDGVFEQRPLKQSSPFRDQMLDVIARIESGAPITTDGAYGLDVIKAIEKIYSK